MGCNLFGRGGAGNLCDRETGFGRMSRHAVDDFEHLLSRSGKRARVEKETKPAQQPDVNQATHEIFRDLLSIVLRSLFFTFMIFRLPRLGRQRRETGVLISAVTSLDCCVNVFFPRIHEKRMNRLDRRTDDRRLFVVERRSQEQRQFPLIDERFPQVPPRRPETRRACSPEDPRQYLDGGRAL